MTTLKNIIPILLLLVLLIGKLDAGEEPNIAVQDVIFADLEISSQNRLLFTVKTRPPRFSSYSTLMVSDLSSDEEQLTRQLTFFPENITLIKGNNEIQIQNRFGVFRSVNRRSSVVPVEDLPNFNSGALIKAGSIIPAKESPDGSYLLYFRPHGFVFGSLLLKELTSGQEIVISRRIELTPSGPPVLWSPDSSFFLYSKEGALYYYSLAQLRANRVLNESLRRIGRGHINSIQWANDNQLYMLVRSTLYAIRNQELFARGLYQDIIQLREIIGTIPFIYNPALDSFSVSPDGQRVLLVKNQRDLFLHSFQKDDDALQSSFAISYNSFRVDLEVARIIWINSRNLLLLARDFTGNESLNRVYRIQIDGEGRNYSLVIAPERQVRDIALSNNTNQVAVATPNQVYVKNPQNWNNLAVHQHPQAFTTLWSNEDQLIIAGAYLIEERSPLQDARKIVALASVTDHGFDGVEGRILAASGNAAFYFDEQLNNWQSSAIALSNPSRERQVTSQDYRTFLGSLDANRYRNQVHIRNLNNYSIINLIKSFPSNYQPLPERDEQIDLTHFKHGSRTRSRKVGLALNAIDSVEGLNRILATLRDYGIRVTFFLNGNFIRSYPQETRTINEAGHEVGSLFSSYFDMTDIKYQIESRFVQQGLSNTEDLYNQTTRKGLTLLWHAPYYFTNPAIIEAAQEAGYNYIGRDVVGENGNPNPISTLNSVGNQQSLWQTIERILQQKKAGSIISIRIGSPPDTTVVQLGDEKLAANLVLLLDALIEQGYSVVPISEIYREARDHIQ